MGPKIFLTGATGYIGGDVLAEIGPKHPDAEITALVRSKDKGDLVKSKYPNVQIVLGGLDDSDIIEREASKADIVIHTADASDHVAAANAIAKGLVAGHSKEKPGYWLHIGGTGILTYFDSSVKRYGEPSDKVFNDDEGVAELTSLPAEAWHRDVDEIVLECGTKHADSVKTVIICPPTIYGTGRGPVSGRSRQVYDLAAFILRNKYCPRIGKGLARWNNVHIHDLSVLFDLLINAALSPSKSSDPDIWGAKGYFLAENGEHVWGEISEAIGKEAAKQGLVPEDIPTKELSYEDAINSPAGMQAATWALNSRGKAIRARKVLGWTPKGPSLEDELPNVVKSEAELLKK